jgi:tetratricopeptide (TPR) repeat protein
LYSHKKYEKAARVLSALLEAHPQNHEAWNDLGVVYLTLNNIKSAMKCIINAIRLKENYQVAISNLRFFYSSSEIQTEIDIISKALSVIKAPLSCNKLKIPFLVFITGQKCNLRCRDCGNFTPYLP